MIEKKLNTINGKILLKIPTRINELTLGQLMAMQEKPYLNDLDAISILSGVAIDDLNNVRNIDDLQVFNEYIFMLSEQIKGLYENEVVPKKVTFYPDKNPVTIKVISNLSVEPAGAFMAARDIISDEINEHIKKHGEDNWQSQFNPSVKACCQVLAHYFFCGVTGKRYDEYEVDKFIEDTKQLSVTEALPIARHFFYNYPGSLRRKPNFFRLLQQLWKKRQAYKHLKNLNISIPLTL
jgi:hypothetical protein